MAGGMGVPVLTGKPSQNVWPPPDRGSPSHGTHDLHGARPGRVGNAAA